MIWAVYIFIFILFFCLKKINTEQAKNIFLFLVTIILCTLSALRHLGMGNDTFAYYMYFNDVDNTSYVEYFEILKNSIFDQSNDSNKDPGYNIISKFAYNILGGNFEFYQFFVSALVLIPIALFVKNYVKLFSGYIIAYIYFISIFYSWLPNSATRQSIAFGLYLWAIWIYLKRNKRIVPIILFLFALTIHKSVLINILPLILLIKIDKKNYPKIAIIGFILMLTFGTYITIRLGQISMSDNYLGYGESTYYQRAGKPYGFIIQLISIYLIALFGKIQIIGISKFNQFIIINFLLAVVFVPIILVDPSLQRLTAYFASWGIVFIPNILVEYPVQERKLVYIILLLLTFGRPLLLGVDDYKFNWQEKELHQRYG